MMLKFFDTFGVILLVLKQNAATFSSKSLLHTSFVLLLIVMEFYTKSFEICTEFESKTTKLFDTFFLQIQGQIEAFLFYKFYFSLDESSLKQQVDLLFEDYQYSCQRNLSIV